MIKRVASVALTLVLIISTICVNAEGFAHIELECDDVYSNNLFDVYIKSDDAELIGGGVMTLSYDSTMVEYREAVSGNIDIQAKESGGCLRMVFMKSNARGDDGELVRLRFKPVSRGSVEFDLSGYGFVDEQLDDLVVQSTGLIVELNKESISSQKGKTTKSSSQSSSLKDDDVTKMVVQGEKSDASFFGDNDTLRRVQSQNTDSINSVIVILSGVVMVAAIVMVAIMFCRKRRNEEDAQDNTEEVSADS